MFKSQNGNEENPLSLEAQLQIWLSDQDHQSSVNEAHDEMPRIPDNPKTLEKATKLHHEGNLEYHMLNSETKLSDIYVKYAGSIAHAPINSKEMAMSYGNLSRILLCMEKHRECVQAIDCYLKLDHADVDDSKLKIYLRKIECLKILNEVEKAKEVYDQTLAWIEMNGGEKIEMKEKLENCYKKEVEVKKPFTNEEIDIIWDTFSIETFNKEVPGASKIIRLEHSESKGRHYIAQTEIKAGDVLMKVRPYVIVCNQDSRYKSCWECCKSLTNCIPCDHCEKVIFCSEKCKEKAWEEYHYVECKLLPFFFKLSKKSGYFEILIASFRLFLIGIREYGSVHKMRKHFEKALPSKDPRTKGFINGQLVVDKYEGFINLTSCCSDFDGKLMVSVTTLMYQILTTTTLFGPKNNPSWKKLTKNKDFIFAVCAFVRHMDIVKANRLNVKKDFGVNGSTSVSVISIPASFFNHSCIPNAFTIQTKDYTKIVAFRPIKTGEQIFLHHLEDVSFIKDEIDTIFKMAKNKDCDCDTCTFNWPSHVPSPKLYLTPAKSARFEASIKKEVEDYSKAVTEMDTKHGEDISEDYKNMTEILQAHSEAIEKMKGNFPEPFKYLFEVQSFVVTFCSKLHEDLM